MTSERISFIDHHGPVTTFLVTNNSSRILMRISTLHKEFSLYGCNVLITHHEFIKNFNVTNYWLRIVTKISTLHKEFSLYDWPVAGNE